MDRKIFLKSSALLGTLFWAPEIMNANGHQNQGDENNIVNSNKNKTKMQFINFGPVHLSVTDLERSIHFWLDIVGMEIRNNGIPIEVGTSKRTLVFLHPDAKVPKRKGYSGLYHVAIHVPTERELAQQLLRLVNKGWRVAPTDHIIAKSLYLDDPDGINIEFAVETPQRVVRIVKSDNNFQVIDDKGNLKNPIEPLDVKELYTHLVDDSAEHPFPENAIVGHFNLHQPNLNTAYDFYKKLAFTEHVIVPGQGWGDLGAGGVVDHRIAVNVWAGVNAPRTPEGMAGLKFLTMKYDTSERLSNVLSNFPNAEKTEEGFLIQDPAGNRILLSQGFWA